MIGLLGPLLLFATAVCAAEPFAENPAWRGVLEGHYGRPWGWRRRTRFVRWMGEAGFNLFVTAPKDAPWQRERWREPFSPEDLSGLEDLIRAGRESGVETALSLSPKGVDLGALEEVRAAVGKYRSAAALGFRRFVIAFDDTHPEPRQIDFANRVLSELSREVPGCEMTFVPALYWGRAAGSEYVAFLRRRLDPRFRVAWTGPEIISSRIDAADVRSWRSAVGRAAALGDNFPVQDRLKAAGRIFLGPLRGRGPRAARETEVWVANAHPLEEAAKVPLRTVAAFLKDPSGYDPAHAWEEAARAEGGSVLWEFARENGASWLSFGAPPLQAAEPAGGLPARLKRLGNLDVRLRGAVSPELYEQLRPWSEQLAREARWVSRLLDSSGSPEEIARSAAETLSSSAVVADGFFEDLAGALAAEARAHAYPARLGPTLVGEAGLETTLEAWAQSWERTASLLGGDEEKASFWRDALPGLRIASTRAKRVLAALRGKPVFASGLRARLDKLRALALLLSRSVVLRHLDPGRSQSVSERAALFCLRWTRPSSLPARLDSAVRRWEAHREEAPLRAIYEELSRVPGELSRAAFGSYPSSLRPWVNRLAAFGEAGLAKLDGAADAADRAEALASGNGLESLLEDLFTLRKLEEYARLEREGELELKLPANPGEML